jgi:2-polyprenyl-6-methoxyphenol hydroxylase-like FAD-dependent oxidoreductase
MALGDVHILNDPVIAQGANTASRCAQVLSEALAPAAAIDETFCRETEQKLWEAARSATEWTNATLQPPPLHVLELFGAAARNGALANELVENFGSPDINWKVFGSPEGARDFAARFAA